MTAWPFLFSRGNVLDNQIIVCPEVLQHETHWGAFSRIVATKMSESTLSDEIKVEDVKSRDIGSITLAYVANHAIRNGEIARDIGNRPIRMIRGVMIEGKPAAEISPIAADLMASVTPSLDAAFDAFWEQAKESGPRFSRGFDVGDEKHGTGTSDHARPPKPDKTGPVKPVPEKRRAWRKRSAAVVMLALVPSILLAAAFYRYHGQISHRLKVLEMRLEAHHEMFENLARQLEQIREKTALP
jgi:hypothetical protein